MKQSAVEWLIRAIDRHLSEESKIALQDTFKAAREMESFESQDRTTTTCAKFVGSLTNFSSLCMMCGLPKSSHI